MKNHEIVPTNLIASIAKLKFGGVNRSIANIARYKLIHHDAKKCTYSTIPCCISNTAIDDGYKLTYAGYDFLALKALTSRGVIEGVGSKVGVGKESGIYLL